MKKQELVDLAKAKGLDIAEDALMDVVDFVFEAGEELIKKSPNKYDDLVLMVLPQLKGIVEKELDKLDGEVDLAE